jgi:hypothetical protein
VGRQFLGPASLPAPPPPPEANLNFHGSRVTDRSWQLPGITNCTGSKDDLDGMHFREKSPLDEKEVRLLATLYEEFTEESGSGFMEKYYQDIEYLDLFIMGSYSDGKSTFLNAFLMLDKVNLPTGFRPTTSRPWRLSYGNRPEIWGLDAAGKKLFAKSWEEIKGYQKIRVNQQPEYYDAQICSEVINVKDVVIWDMPGFDDPERVYDPERAVEFIKRHELAIFVCCWESHGNLDEILKQLFEAGQHEFYVIVTNARNNEEFAERRHHYQQEIFRHLQKELPRASFRVYGVDSVKAMHFQKQLDQFARDLKLSKNVFLEQITPQDLNKNLPEEFQEVLKHYQDSGMVEVRQALKNIFDNAGAIIRKKISRRLQKNLEDIQKSIARRRGKLYPSREDLHRQRDHLEEQMQGLRFEIELTSIMTSLQNQLKNYFDKKTSEIASNYLKAIRECRPSIKPGIIWKCANLFFVLDKQTLEANKLSRLLWSRCTREAGAVIETMIEQLPDKLARWLEEILRLEQKSLEQRLSEKGLLEKGKKLFTGYWNIDVTEVGQKLADLHEGIIEGYAQCMTRLFDALITKERISDLQEAELSHRLAQSVTQTFWNSLIPITEPLAGRCQRYFNQVISKAVLRIKDQLKTDLIAIQAEILKISSSLSELDNKQDIINALSHKIAEFSQGG